MKVKFDISEDNRLKAYYLLQLREKADLPFPSVGSSIPAPSISFNSFLNEFAKDQFCRGLDVEIADLEKLLFTVEV